MPSAPTGVSASMNAIVPRQIDARSLALLHSGVMCLLFSRLFSSPLYSLLKLLYLLSWTRHFGGSSLPINIQGLVREVQLRTSMGYQHQVQPSAGGIEPCAGRWRCSPGGSKNRIAAASVEELPEEGTWFYVHPRLWNLFLSFLPFQNVPSFLKWVHQVVHPIQFSDSSRNPINICSTYFYSPIFCHRSIVHSQHSQKTGRRIAGRTRKGFEFDSGFEFEFY